MIINPLSLGDFLLILYILLYFIVSKQQFNSVCSLNHEITFIRRVNSISVFWNVRFYSSADRFQRFGGTCFIFSQVFCIEAGGGKFRRLSTCLLKYRASHTRQNNFLLTSVDASKPNNEKVKLSLYRP